MSKLGQELALVLLGEGSVGVFLWWLGHAGGRW